MRYNIINEIDFKWENKYDELFSKIENKVTALLNVKENYVFSLILTDPENIHEINKTYRGIDRPTDVISFASMDSDDCFDYDDEIEIGDIFINMEAVKKQSIEYGHSFDREFAFLFTHGVLHLLGYDHMEKEEEIIMFKLQDEILDGIIER